MDETISCEVIDQEKSSYRIELIKASNGKYFVSIEQKIYSLINESTSEIKIREAGLDKIINTLKEFQAQIPITPPKRGLLTPARKAELLNRYLNKNLEIETLAVQFDCTDRQVEQLLFDENIVVTTNKIVESSKGKKFWGRKKRSGK